MKYVLVEWESDSTVSVVPAKRLKTRDGKRITQAWPGGVFAGSILQESGRSPNVSKGCAIMLITWSLPGYIRYKGKQLQQECAFFISAFFKCSFA